MTEPEIPGDQRLPALGEPPGELNPDPDDDGDFANEHEITAVAHDIIVGDDLRERESPHGWSGMDHDSDPPI